jgi:hypothetical protein
MPGIDSLVGNRADLFANNPQGLQQRYAQSQDLLDLLALQKLKTDKEAAARNMQMQMQAPAGTVKDQREQQVLDMTKREIAQQVAPGLAMQGQRMAASQPPRQARPTPTGVAALPAPNISPQMMAGGGIVAFQEGGMPQQPPAESQMDIDIRMYQAAQRVANDQNATAEVRRRAQMEMERIKNQLGSPNAIAKFFQTMDERNQYPGLARGGVVGYQEGGDIEVYTDDKGRTLTRDDIKMEVEAGTMTPGATLRDKNNAPIPAIRIAGQRREPAPKVSQGPRFPTPRPAPVAEAPDIYDLLNSMLTNGRDMDATMSGPEPVPSIPKRPSPYDIRQAEKEAGRRAVRADTREFQGPTQDMLRPSADSIRQAEKDAGRRAVRAGTREFQGPTQDMLEEPQQRKSINEILADAAIAEGGMDVGDMIDSPTGQRIINYVKENPYDAISNALMFVPLGGQAIGLGAKGLAALARSNRLRKLAAPLFTKATKIPVKGYPGMPAIESRVFDPMRTMFTTGAGMQLGDYMFGGEGGEEDQAGLTSLVSSVGGASTSTPRAEERPFVGPTQDMLRDETGYRPGDPMAPESPESQAGAAARAERAGLAKLAEDDQAKKREIDWDLLAAGLANMGGRPKGRVAGSFTQGVMGEKQRREEAQLERDKLAQATEQAGLERQNRLEIAKMQVDAGTNELQARLDAAANLSETEARMQYLSPEYLQANYKDAIDIYVQAYKDAAEDDGVAPGWFESSKTKQKYEANALNYALNKVKEQVSREISDYYASTRSIGSSGSGAPSDVQALVDQYTTSK